MTEPLEPGKLIAAVPAAQAEGVESIQGVAPAGAGDAAEAAWPSPDLAAAMEVLDVAEQRRFPPEAALARLGGTLMRLDGRAARSEYWWGSALLSSLWILLTMALVALLGSASLVIVVAAGLGLIVLLPFVVVLEVARAVRRLHDADLAGRWVALALLPGGVLAVIWLLTRPGTPGLNRYGAMSQPGLDRTAILSA